MQLNNKVIEHIIRDDADYSEVELLSEKENILLVEGVKDKEMIEYVYRVLGKKQDFDIIPMQGVSNIPKFSHALENQENLNIRYLTDNDYSARRWLKSHHLNTEDVITDYIYGNVKNSIKELEEYLTDTPHYKHKPAKKKLIRNIFDWKDVSINNAKHLIRTIKDCFANVY